ncbi:hypothetical protein KC946_01420 [Candidatus Saccharibacteria bacterium]|nr:hypothetical protein [Candidatus Saccharibacteria bacterium]
MAVLKPQEKQRVVTGSILSMLIIGVITFAILIIGLATRLNAEPGIQTAAIGPFTLFELYKVPSPAGGFNAGLSFRVGALYYSAFWLVIGSVFAWFRVYSHKTPK